jgi:hypothetical protein
MRSAFPVAFLDVALLGLPAVAHADGAFDAKFAGHYQCHSTTFFWPTNPDEPPVQSATGTTDLVSDGSGRFSSGSGVVNVLDDTARPGSLVTCHFTLREGTYAIAPAGVGVAQMQWDLVPGSGPHCSNYVPGDLRPTGSIDETLPHALTSF